MPPTRCFFQIKGLWYALMNWQARVSPGDAVVFHALSPHDVDALHTLRRQGLDEPRIFARLFPPQTTSPSATQVHVPISLLTKGQLAHVIAYKLGTELPSLTRMRKNDLQALLQHLCNQAIGHGKS